MRELAEKNGITVDCIAPPFLESSHIDKEKHPAIMLAESPQRDRDIEVAANHDQELRRGGDSVDQIQHEPAGSDAHRPHSGAGRRNIQHVASEGRAPGDAADARGRGGCRCGLGTHHLFSGSRDSGGARVQGPHGVPSARSGRSSGRLSGRGARAGNGGWAEAAGRAFKRVRITASISARARFRKCCKTRARKFST